ncbi:NADH pyrophosphatase [Entomortierella beljakovae]|nr:NADH pyrophosphatase [Entomortierella beljakovae]
MADWWKRRTILENLPIQFSGQTHNRTSFLRTDNEYLEESLKASTTRFIILADHGVLFKSTTKDLAFAGYDDIKHLIGSDPLNNIPHGLVLAFLGVDETGNDQPLSSQEVLVKGRRGIGYWAIDLSAKGPKVTKELKDSAQQFIDTFPEKYGHYMAEMRPASFKLSFPESGMLAQARSVADWNKRNQFCPACGSQTISLEGGHKRSCPATIVKDGQETPSDCLAHKGTQNFTYPRTDPVAIVCIISPDGERVLLGRGIGWPAGSYSCIAGFIEPGESIEEAARREAKEETGVRLGHVMYYASQPWPFPNTIMIGCLAEALDEDIDITKEDKELEDARWFTRQEVLTALKSKNLFFGKPSDDPNTLRISPPTAIAHHLLRTWATQEGEVPHSRM